MNIYKLLGSIFLTVILVVVAPHVAARSDLMAPVADKASLALEELAGEQGDEYNTDEVSGTSGQAADQVANSASRQINWRGSRAK